jgi:hypothetical protein
MLSAEELQTAKEITPATQPSVDGTALWMARMHRGSEVPHLRGI